MVNAPSSQPNPGLFRIAPPAVARHPGALLAPRDLRRWVDALPLANPPKAAQELLQQLRMLVRDPQPGKNFAALLAIYQAPVDQLLEIVDERLHGKNESAVPLDQLEHALLELLTEQAFGHLRIANQALGAGKTPSAETLYQAMQLLDSALNTERLHYFRPAPENWQLLVQIYRHADAAQLGRMAVAKPVHGQTRPVTIEGLLFRALIISLCDPHHHRPSEILDWHSWTGAHTDLLELTVLPQGPFAIPVDISGALTPLTGARCGKPGPDMRYLAADQFLQRLQDDADAPKGLYRALSDLIKGRKAPEQRQSPRQARNHPFKLLHGLRNIHARLETLTQGTTPTDQDMPAVACLQVNQSRSGAAFRLSGRLIPPLTVGEPILVEADTPSRSGAPVGFAGRIQRLMALDEDTIEIGVEKLQGRLIPVEISGTAAERARGNAHALLQHIVETDRYALLAPRVVYREGETLATESTNARYMLRMTGLLAVVQQIAFVSVEPVDF